MTGEKEVLMENSVIRITDRILVTGMTGTGKTFFTKWFIKYNLLGRIKVFVFDPLWQYQDLGKVHHSLQSIDNSELKDLKLAIVFQPDPVSDNEQTLDLVSKWILERNNIFFVIEEITYYMNASYSTPYFEAVAKRGRNFGIGILGVSQRPARIDLDFVGIINHWIIFPQDCKPDLERLYTYLERANPDFNPDFIATMPDRYFIHYWRDRESGKPQAVLSNPIKADISTTPVK